MPNESVNADYKECLYKVFLAMKPSRRTMVNMYNLIPKVAVIHPKELILAHIANQSAVLEAIIAKKGKRTKF